MWKVQVEIPSSLQLPEVKFLALHSVVMQEFENLNFILRKEYFVYYDIYLKIKSSVIFHSRYSEGIFSNMVTNKDR